MSKGILLGILVAIVVILLLMYFILGKKSVEAPTDIVDGSEASLILSEQENPLPQAPEGEKIVLAGGLEITEVKVGDGLIEAKSHDLVIVHYTGTLLDGTKFDSSFDHAGQEPIRFAIGEGKVIQGWDVGLLGMRKGGKRHLVIPAALAYGAQSPSPLIPPNSTLVFDVEIVDVWQALVNQEKP